MTISPGRYGMVVGSRFLSNDGIPVGGAHSKNAMSFATLASLR